jgi:hypothetical protein
MSEFALMYWRGIKVLTPRKRAGFAYPSVFGVRERIPRE